MVLTGVVFMLAGLALAIFPVMAVVMSFDTLIRTGEPLSVNDDELMQIVGLALGAVVAAWLGVLLLRGRRHLGLYLRKFGFADTTRTVSHALRSAVGRSVRLVTLDDSMVAPVGVGAGKWIASLMRIVAFGLLAWLLYYLVGGGFDADSDNIFADVMRQISGAQGDGVAEQLAGAIVGSMVAGVIVGLFLVVILTLLIIAGLVGMFAYRAHRSARLAQQEATQALAQRQQVDGVAKKLKAVARRVFAPRLMVVAVPGSFWQQAVKGFASVSKVAIMDVSHPTDPLIWEVQTLKPLFGDRLIYVGSREHVLALARPANEIAGSPTGLLAQLLDGAEIIAYGPAPADRRRFTKALRRRIANIRST